MENGIALYNIELNDCLNGVYTNDGLKGEIFNEIARLKFGTEKGADGLSGEYDCIYFGNKNNREGHTLIISVTNAMAMSLEYKFLWKNKKDITVFEGTGYKMNQTQIAVHYRYVEND